jgi:protocatechuate 4,5-dioxygenase beta chain
VARLVGVFAASHMPPMVNAPDAAGPQVRAEAFAAYASLGERLRACAAEALVLVGPDHFQNFFVDNLPGILVGVGESHEGPAEPWMKGAPERFVGHPALGAHLLDSLYGAGFEPAFSLHLRLDHGYALPLRFGGIGEAPPIVPVVINAVQPPFPRVARCYALGAAIADAVRTFPGGERVAVLASDGLSHSIGEPDMGRIDTEFDAGFLRHMGESEPQALLNFAERNIHAAGNGAQEMRNWVVAHGAAGGTGFEKLYYRAVPEWFTGLCLATWNLEERTNS